MSAGAWILVVDDDEDIRDTLTLLLDVKGYAVAGAADGIEALQLIRTRGCPGLILLDLRMPRMNGEELVAALRADQTLAAAPIVVFSGDSNAAEVAAAIDAIGLLKKPIDLTQLVEMVQRVIG